MSSGGLRAGGCLCGKVRYALASAPQMSMVCHCKHCQRQAGSAMSVIVGLPESDVTIEGEVRTYADTGDSGGAVLRQFCPECGSPLFTRVDAAPGMLFIKAGTLDDTSGLNPAMHCYTSRKQEWVELGAIPAFETMPQR